MAKKSAFRGIPKQSIAEPAPESWLTFCCRGWHPYLGITLAGSLLYLRILRFGYTYLDDNALILDNQGFLRQLSNIIPAFRMDVFQVLHSATAYYRPLLTVSFILDAQVGGVSPGVYHLTNLLIHLCASCLVYRFLISLEYEKAAALFWALVFTVHPVLAQAVAWIPGRNDSLLAMFVLPAVVFLAGFLRTGRPRWALAHFVFFILAVFAKESAVALVPLGLFYWATLTRERRCFKDAALLLSGWGVILTFWFSLRQVALRHPVHMAMADMARSFRGNSPAVIPSVGKMFFPFNLSVYPILRDMPFLYGYAAVGGLAAALWASRKKSWPRVMFGLSWFCLFLLPSFAIAADCLEHRLYIPMIGVIVILCEINWLQVRAVSSKTALGLAGLVLGALAVGAFVHSRHFADRLSFWKNAAQTSPHSPMAHRNLGAMYYLDGQPSLAEPEYRKALELNPLEQMAHNNLGLIYMHQGRLREAEEQYRKELAVNPLYDNVLFNYGLLCYAAGRGDEAAILWKKTLEVNPDYMDAYRDLAVYYYQRQDFPQAFYYAGLMKKKGAPAPFSSRK
jgi:hypothetical protein